MFKEIIAVCSETHTKEHKHTLCEQNAEFSTLNTEVHIVTTGLERPKIHFSNIFPPMATSILHDFRPKLYTISNLSYAHRVCRPPYLPSFILS